MLYSWNCSRFPVWLWTSHVSQVFKPGAKPLGAQQLENQVFVYLSKYRFRTLIFSILFFFFLSPWPMCLRLNIYMAMLHSRTNLLLNSGGALCSLAVRPIIYIQIYVPVFSLQGWSCGDSSFWANNFHLRMKRTHEHTSTSSGLSEAQHVIGGNALIPYPNRESKKLSICTGVYYASVITLDLDSH